MTHRLMIPLAGGLLILSLSGRALADDPKEEAKNHFTQGVALFDEGNFEAALAEFRASYNLFPNFRVLKNTSACLKSLFRYGEAISTLELYLKNGESKLKGPEKQEIQDAIDEMRSLLAPVTVEVRETGATIKVGDTVVGNSPLPKPILMDPGEHLITATLDGFTEVQSKVMIASGQAQKVTLTLEKVKTEGKVVIKSSVGASTVKIDGRDVGRTPWEGTLPAGGHELEVTADGMKPFVSELVIAANQTREISVELTPLVEKGHARIEASEPGASVFIDGENKGFAPWEGDLTAGGHQLEVIHDDKAPYRTELTITAGQNRTVVAKLENKVVAGPAVEEDNTGLYWGLGVAGGLIVAGGITVLGLWLGGILWPNPESPVDGSLPPYTHQL